MTLTKDELWELRQEIVLNSLFTKDYSNSFEVPDYVCHTFFDGYVMELYLLSDDDNFQSDDLFDVIEKYDNKDNLYNYYSQLEGYPLYLL